MTKAQSDEEDEAKQILSRLRELEQERTVTSCFGPNCIHSADDLAGLLERQVWGGTPYIGVTDSQLLRIGQHRVGNGGKFTRRYKVTQRVWFEEHAPIEEAIQREKNLKRYLRDWKINLIEASNPHWTDLYPALRRRYGRSDGAKHCTMGPRPKAEDDR